MRASGQQVPIVRVDFLQAILGGASQVQGIGGPQVDRGGQTRIHGEQARHDRRGNREPGASAAFAVPLEFGYEFPKLFRIDCPLAQLAVEGRNRFRLAVKRASQRIRRSQGPHFFPAWIAGIEPHKVTRIEIER